MPIYQSRYVEKGLPIPSCTPPMPKTSPPKPEVFGEGFRKKAQETITFLRNGKFKSPLLDFIADTDTGSKKPFHAFHIPDNISGDAIKLYRSCLMELRSKIDSGADIGALFLCDENSKQWSLEHLFGFFFWFAKSRGSFVSTAMLLMKSHDIDIDGLPDLSSEDQLSDLYAQWRFENGIVDTEHQVDDPLPSYALQAKVLLALLAYSK